VVDELIGQSQRALSAGAMQRLIVHADTALQG
jgi:hypothetical protein